MPLQYRVMYGRQSLSIHPPHQNSVRLVDLDCHRMNRRKVTCFTCGWDSHTQRTCPLSRCLYCSEYGHHEQICPNKSFDLSNFLTQPRLDIEAQSIHGPSLFSDAPNRNRAAALLENSAWQCQGRGGKVPGNRKHAWGTARGGPSELPGPDCRPSERPEPRPDTSEILQ
jgi:hypothetical protein